MHTIFYRFSAGLAAVLGLLGLVFGLMGANEGLVVAGGIWFGSALIASEIANCRKSTTDP